MSKALKTTAFLSIFISIGLFFFTKAQEEAVQFAPPQQVSMKGKVVGATEITEQEIYGQIQKVQTLKVKITSGEMEGQEAEVIHGIIPEAGAPEYKVGDKVYILKATAADGVDVFYITDYDRTGNMLILFVVFAFFVILVSRFWGVSSLIGMAYTFLIIFKFLLPKISDGGSPVLISVAAAAMIAPVTFYLSHGVNRKTTTALIGTIISLVITGLLATAFIGITKLTGFGSEEALFLQVATGGTINIKGLLLAGIIIGSLGVLDDVTVTQTSLVNQLRKTDKSLDATELFRRAMDVGHDHIASTVNTLVLVYTGAALPLLLLFIDNPISTAEVLNSEIIAEEVVRTLVSSIGLILAIPITTFIAVIDNKEDVKAAIGTK